jgi:hypothetical protein
MYKNVRVEADAQLLIVILNVAADQAPILWLEFI